jgi:hypothetical protein
MDQTIFKIGLSTEAISTYLLCCSLADDGTAISTKNLLNVWNSTQEVLEESLRALEERRILKRVVSNMEDNTVFKLTDVHGWELTRK